VVTRTINKKAGTGSDLGKLGLTGRTIGIFVILSVTLASSSSGSTRLVFSDNGQVFFRRVYEGEYSMEMVIRDSNGTEQIVAKPGDPVIPWDYLNPDGASPSGDGNLLGAQALGDFLPKYDFNENGQYAFIDGLISSPLANGDFEDGTGDSFDNWTTTTTGDAVIGASSDGGIDGGRALQIQLGTIGSTATIQQANILELDTLSYVFFMIQGNVTGGDISVDFTVNGSPRSETFGNLYDHGHGPNVTASSTDLTITFTTDAESAGHTILIDKMGRHDNLAEEKHGVFTALPGNPPSVIAQAGDWVDGFRIFSIMREVAINKFGEIGFEAEIAGYGPDDPDAEGTKGLFRFAPTGPFWGNRLMLAHGSQVDGQTLVDVHGPAQLNDPRRHAREGRYRRFSNSRGRLHRHPDTGTLGL